MRFSTTRFLLVNLVALFLLANTPSAGALEDGRLGLFDAKISPDGTMVAFAWVGDIWVVEVDTGQCRRVTDNVAHDYHPVWFPDNSKLAFTSNRDGNDDIYTVGVNGGIPTRHTWHINYDIALDVTPDGENILFRGYRTMYQPDLFVVDIHGGLPRPVTSDTGVKREACYSWDGEQIVASRGSAGWTRRQYNGSGDTDLLVMNSDGSDIRWIERGYDGNDFWPCYGANDEEIYFVSDRNGMENIFKIPAEGGPAEQLTFFDDRPVLFLSSAENGRISFIQDFRLWVMDPGEEPRVVDLDCSSEPKHSQDVRLDISGNVSEFEVSPLGTHLALIVRGELYITTLHEPDETATLGDQRFWESVRVTESVSRERDVAWHPDGDRVVLISDRNGNNEVYEVDLRTFEWTQVTDTPVEEYRPMYSPDGSILAYWRGNTELIVRDMETDRERVILHRSLQNSPWPENYAWSPDGRWIAYTGLDQLNEEEVWVVNVDDGADPVNVTLHHDYDTFSGWSEDGKNIYFMSNRGLNWGMNGWGSWSRGSAVYCLPLIHEPAPRSDLLEFPEEEDEEEPDEEESGENGDEEDEVPEEEINFNRIEERARLVSPTSGGGWWAALSPDSSTFVYTANPLGVNTLYMVPFEGGSATRITDVPSGIDYLQWLPDGRGVFYQTDGRIYFWEKSSKSTYQVPINGRLTINLADERVQMINETERILRNHFYDEDMHGTDWAQAIEFYTPFVREAAAPEEFQLLMRMLFGELDASHLSCYAASSREGIASNPGFLGVEFNPFTEGPGLQVTRVWPRGPAEYESVDIEVGDWVQEINGEPVSTGRNYWELLDDAVARTTILTVASGQYTEEFREVEIAPVVWYSRNPLSYSHYECIYFDWVERNRELVETATDGRIGYVHISGMSGTQLERFAQELFTENLDKEAIIIDVRFNGGGNTHEQLIDILSRPQFGWNYSRDVHRIPMPYFQWNRPTVVMINERSFSDAEIFPSAFRDVGLGVLIGETTFGGVIGTWNISLVDNQTRIRVPRVGWYTLAGENMENTGVVPDIRIEQDLNHLRDGIDDQLNAAIRYLLGEL